MKLRRFTLLAALVFATALFATALVREGAGQTRNRPSRRATNPVRTTRAVAPAPTPLPSPDASEPRLVSAADGAGAQDETAAPTRRRTGRTTTATRRAADEAERDEMRETVERLSNTVTKLSDEVTQLKGEQRILVDLERLTRAEQRAEGLRAQLRDVADKEFALQERAAQLEEELEPDAIERRAALIGSLNPAAVRDSIRRGLERERDRVRAQLEMLATSRVRLESAVASADNEVTRIKARIEAAENEQGGPTTNTSPTPAVNTTGDPARAPERETSDTPPPPDEP
ncbi:MAG TPA: hypothetical protein VER32_12300 [Pyrinomonadaceae bacterium]|nr:hypothetical protein [Pyrinomonadaceae bacterium]